MPAERRAEAHLHADIGRRTHAPAVLGRGNRDRLRRSPHSHDRRPHAAGAVAADDQCLGSGGHRGALGSGGKPPPATTNRAGLHDRSDRFMPPLCLPGCGARPPPCPPPGRQRITSHGRQGWLWQGRSESHSALQLTDSPCRRPRCRSSTARRMRCQTTIPMTSPA
jgi:hypothetical protein